MLFIKTSIAQNLDLKMSLIILKLSQISNIECIYVSQLRLGKNWKEYIWRDVWKHKRNHISAEL